MGKILFIRGGALGDFLLTLPAMHALRSQLQDSEIHILGYPAIASIAKAVGLAEDVRSIDYAPLARFFIPGTSLDEELVDYFKSFDLVISYLFDPDGFFQSNLERCGVESLIAGPGKVDPAGGHAAVQLAVPLEQLAIFMDDPCPVLSVGGEDGKKLGGAIAIHPGSGGRNKIWPVEHWIELGKWIHSTWPERELILIIGEVEKEKGIDQEVVTPWKQHQVAHRVLDCLSIPELAASVQSCGLFVGHDTGVSHLAATVGVPSVLLFGPTDPGVWAPRTERNLVIRDAGFQVENIPIELVKKAVSGRLR